MEYRAEYVNVSDKDFSCSQAYRDALFQFVDSIKAFSALKYVWQSSTGKLNGVA